MDHTAQLLQRAQGKIPEKRPEQSAAERKREIDETLKSVPALRAERKQMAALERQDAKDATNPEDLATKPLTVQPFAEYCPRDFRITSR